MIINNVDDYNNLKNGEPYSFYCKTCGRLINISHKRSDVVNKTLQQRLLCKKCGTRKTCIERFNAPSALSLKENRIDDKLRYTKDDFVKKAVAIHGDKYDYSLVDYVSSGKKVKIICNSHYHSGYVFEQTPHCHLCGKGCPVCAGNVPMSNDEFAIRAREVHGDIYDYSQAHYVNAHTKVKIICPKHGAFEQVARCHLDFGQGCPLCNESKGERLILLFLEKQGIKFIRQKKFNDCIDKKQLSYDFFLPDLNTLIEFNGAQHYKNFRFKSHNLRVQRHHDWLKRKYARDNNYKLIIIPYWESNIDETLQKELFNGNEEKR